MGERKLSALPPLRLQSCHSRGHFGLPAMSQYEARARGFISTRPTQWNIILESELEIFQHRKCQ
jgi:hypothetical protein